jgi:hypothetical protein
MHLRSYGKPTRGGAAKKGISEASFRPTEAAHKTVDTQLRLTKADAALFIKINCLSRPRKYML